MGFLVERSADLPGSGCRRNTSGSSSNPLIKLQVQSYYFCNIFMKLHNFLSLTLSLAATILQVHTYAKLIEIQKIHGLHELGSQMVCNDTLHGSELGPHFVLGPNN